MTDSLAKCENLSVNIIRDVLYHKFAEEFVEIFAKDVIRSWLDDTEEIVVSEQQKQKLEVIWNELMENVKNIVICRANLFFLK